MLMKKYNDLSKSLGLETMEYLEIDPTIELEKYNIDLTNAVICFLWHKVQSLEKEIKELKKDD